MRLPLYAIAAFVVANASVYAAAPDLPPRQSRTAPLLVAFPGQAELPTLSQILTLNATNGTFLPLHNIQGDILVGMKKQKERFVFFKINNAAQFKSTLKNYIPARITSTATLIGPHTQQPLAFVNLAFSNMGLHTLGITDNLGDQQFSSGQFADAENLGDDLSQWATPFTGAGIHGVFLIGSDQDAYLDQYSDEISSTFGSSISQLVSLSGSVRPGNQAGHEHFGFLDGISQPAVSGWALRALPGQAIVPTGVILTGHIGDTTHRPAWARDGTFMAFRHLQEKVPEFHAWTLANALNASSAGNLTQEEGAELLGARMFGRWKSGAPLPLAPTQDDPELGADPERNNVYSYVNTAFDQTKCPFSAHARKTNPRSDQPLFSIANHAIRSSITYGPETSSEELASGTSAEDRGVLFVEYQSDIGNGFRFQQINWANTANFPPFKPTTPGIDPIIGRGTPPTTGGLDPLNQTKTYTVPPFVIPKGGEYFFMPSISALTGTIAN